MGNEFLWTLFFKMGEFSLTKTVYYLSPWVNFREHVLGEFYWTLFDGDNK